jgi:hypothetical protein
MKAKKAPEGIASGIAGEFIELKDQGTTKFVTNKFDHDLFDETKHTVQKVLSIKRVSSPNHGERWKIIEDSKIIFIVDGNKLTKKEKEYLRTPEGVSFLLSYHKKNGINNINLLKAEIKQNIGK